MEVTIDMCVCVCVRVLRIQAEAGSSIFAVWYIDSSKVSFHFLASRLISRLSSGIHSFHFIYYIIIIAVCAHSLRSFSVDALYFLWSTRWSCVVIYITLTDWLASAEMKCLYILRTMIHVHRPSTQTHKSPARLSVAAYTFLPHRRFANFFQWQMYVQTQNNSEPKRLLYNDRATLLSTAAQLEFDSMCTH